MNDDPNFEAMPGDSLAPVVLREARDSNLRRPDPPPSLLGWMVGGGDHDVLDVEGNHLPESFESWLAREEVDLYCAPSPSSLARRR